MGKGVLRKAHTASVTLPNPESQELPKDSMQDTISTPKDFKLTADFDRALKLMENTMQNILITGDSGTGKSTLLHLFKESTKKDVVILAPTGVAAVNVGGQTLHSFFGLPLGIIGPGNIKTTQFRANLLKHVRTIVIDEISMVRADIMDAIDLSLRLHRGNETAFGGVQMIFIGDLAQLPPVVRKEDEQILRDMKYESEFFFSSAVIKSLGDELRRVNLSEIFRQKDKKFLDILNRIRKNAATDADIYELNKRQSYKRPENGNVVISLTSINKTADAINNDRLIRLKGKPFTCKAKIEGDFEESHYPTDPNLVLKPGAQVMMIRNDSAVGGRRWVNGTLGVVEGRKHGKLMIKIDGEVHEVEQETWKKKRYTYNSGLGSVEEEDTGKFVQFPVKLAWAVTIHKCVSSDTRIPTSLGLIKISDFEKTMPESVAGIRSGQIVSELFDSGEELGYKITTQKGYEIICSERHPLLAVRGGEMCWVKAPELAVGDFLRMRVGTNAFGSGLFDFEKREQNYTRSRHNIPPIMSDELAWLLGILVGDGCVSDKRDGRIDVTCEDMEIIDGFAIICRKVFGINSTIKKHVDRNASLAYAHNKGVREFLESIGLGYETAYDKKIPEAIFTSPISCQSAFLRGLFDTDGGASKNEIHLTTTSEQLGKEVQLLLANIGVISSRRDQSRNLPNEHNQWRVGIMGRQSVSYMDKVGFTIPRKTAAGEWLAERSLNHNVPKSDNGGIPNSRGIAAKMRDEISLISGYKYGEKRHLKIVKHWAKLLSRVACGKTELTDTHLRELSLEVPEAIGAGPVCQEWIGDALAGSFTDEIVSIVREKARMMDIHVPNENAFIGNAFVNHNSQGKTYDKVIIDLGWGAFTHGQTYVALSRCRTLEGIQLIKPLKQKDIIADDNVIAFMNA